MGKEKCSYTAAIRFAAKTALPECDGAGDSEPRWEMSACDGATVFLRECSSLEEALRSKGSTFAAGGALSASMAIVSLSGRNKSAADHIAVALVCAGHPGQLLLCPETAEQVGQCEGNNSPILLGTHVLEEDLPPQEIYQWDNRSPAVSFPPLRCLYQVRHNLPERNSPFFGRARELDEIRHLLRSCKCVTLVGPEGIGKSALAWRCGIEFTEEFPGGVWRIEVEPFDTFQSLRSKLWEVVHAPVAPSDDASGFPNIDSPCLIILDNCDQAIAASRIAFERFRNGIPSAQILATSRDALDVSGETRFPIAGLRCPDSKDIEVERLLEYDAPRLFWDRVLLRDPERTLTVAAAGEITEICRRLGGSPAGLLAVATPYARYGIDRIRKAWNRYASGVPCFPMGEAIQPSFQSLTSHSQHFLAGLSMFSGDWTIRAAVGTALLESTVDYKALLSELLEGGLVEIKLSREGDIRYCVSSSASTYVASLESMESVRKVAADRHLAYFLSLAESNPEEIEREISNLRLALSRALESQNPEFGLKLVVALGPFWHRKGHHREAADLCEGACQFGKTTSEPALPRALNLLGTFRTLTGELSLAADAHEEAFALSVRKGDLLTAAMALGNLATVYKHQREYAVSKAMAKLAVISFRNLNDSRRLAGCLTNYGAILEDVGDWEEATEAFEQAIVLFEELNDEWAATRTRFNLAEMALKGGRVGDAKTIYLDCLERAAAAEDPVFSALCLEGLCFTEERTGAFETAALCLGAAMVLRAKHGAAISATQGERVSAARDSLEAAMGKAKLKAQFESAKSLEFEDALGLIKASINDSLRTVEDNRQATRKAHSLQEIRE